MNQRRLSTLTPVMPMSYQYSLLSFVVAFMAEITTDYLSPTAGRHLVFDSVKINDGYGYHNTHGTFITPVTGLYEISIGVTAHLGADTRTHINIMNSGTAIGYLFFDNLATGYPWIKETESVLVHLTVGDDVWVEVTQAVGSVTIATGGMHTYFSGYLIQADP